MCVSIAGARVWRWTRAPSAAVDGHQAGKVDR